MAIYNNGFSSFVGKNVVFFKFYHQIPSYQSNVNETNRYNHLWSTSIIILDFVIGVENPKWF